MKATGAGADYCTDEYDYYAGLISCEATVVNINELWRIETGVHGVAIQGNKKRCASGACTTGGYWYNDDPLVRTGANQWTDREHDSWEAFQIVEAGVSAAGARLYSIKSLRGAKRYCGYYGIGQGIRCSATSVEERGKFEFFCHGSQTELPPPPPPPPTPPCQRSFTPLTCASGGARPCTHRHPPDLRIY